MSWTVDGLEYPTRKKLTIDATKIDADLTDFPVLVKLTDANFDFAKSNADGYDVRFTDSDGSTLLKYERERHDGADYAEYWVKVPAVDSDNDTDFYMYYRTTDTADGADAANVWDGDYLGVYHLKEDDTGTTIVDSNGANNLTKKGNAEPSQDDGKIAKGQHYDGDDDQISHTTLLDTFPSIFVFECWVKHDSTFDSSATTSRGLFRKYNLIGGPWGYLTANFTESDGKLYIELYTDAAHQLWSTTTSWTGGTWYHVAFTIGTNGMELWVNGASQDTDADTSVPGAGTHSDMLLGIMVNDASNKAIDGILDEFRLSNDTRSSSYIKATYNTGNNSLLTYGAEDTGNSVTITDAIALVESFSKTPAYNGFFTESIGMVGLLGLASKFTNQILEKLELLEILQGFENLVQVTERLILGTAQTIKVKFTEPLIDSITSSEAYSMVSKFLMTIFTSLGLSENVTIGGRIRHWTYQIKNAAAWTFRPKS